MGSPIRNAGDYQARQDLSTSQMPALPRSIQARRPYREKAGLWPKSFETRKQLSQADWCLLRRVREGCKATQPLGRQHKASSPKWSPAPPQPSLVLSLPSPQ